MNSPLAALTRKLHGLILAVTLFSLSAAADAQKGSRSKSSGSSSTRSSSPRISAPRASTPRAPRSAAPRITAPRSSSAGSSSGKILKGGVGSSHKGGHYTSPGSPIVAPQAKRTPSAPKTSKSVSPGARDKNGRIVRSPSAKKQFEKQSGYAGGRKGYVVDHIVPLACGGTDAPSNMQWQTVEAGKAKDKVERRGCK